MNEPMSLENLDKEFKDLVGKPVMYEETKNAKVME
jgi:hypothetical protein